MRCLIYARVSLDPRGQGRSVTEQETECRAWADREHWAVTQVIAETGSASRYAKKTRARWGDVTTALQSGNIDALLVWESSRATRDLAVYTALRDLCVAANVRLGYSGTLYDLTTRGDRFRTGLDALLSEDESARTSERILRASRARATAGQPHGRLPYGYRREYDPTTGALLRQVPNEATAPIVAEIVRRALNQETMISIARDLTARHVPIPRPPVNPDRDPGTWAPQTVWRIARNPAIAGLRQYRGKIIGDATWPGIITPDQHHAVIALLSDPNRLTHHGTAATHLLSGIARCGSCGHTLRSQRTKTPGVRMYACAGCSKVGRRMPPVDRMVTARLLDLLEGYTDQLHDQPDDTPDGLSAARADLDALHARLEQLVEQAADGSITPGTLAKLEARLTPRIAAAEKKVRALLVPSVLTGVNPVTIRDDWPTMPVDDQRQLVRAFLDVRILPAGRTGRAPFDETKVQITPRW